MCGLKLVGTHHDALGFDVTPLAGVRIETKAVQALLIASCVTPLAGVRIETRMVTSLLVLYHGHTSRRCAD